jgi:adenosylcobalamin-dependent ribonucleoside-triphosphate reductase
MSNMALLPAGRQLWATGVEGRQYLFNCHVSGWGEKFSDHFEFTFMRLVEGGGVGANYSTRHIERFGAPVKSLAVHIKADEGHADIDDLRPNLSNDKLGGWLVEDSREGWAESLTYLIDSFMGDEGCDVDSIVFDVSGIRPEGSPLVSSGGVAAGPTPLAVMLLEVSKILNRAHEAGLITPIDVMEIDHAIAVGAVAGGSRRSARMSIVRWDDPSIMDFINCKKDGMLHWTTNISVEVDDEFIMYVNDSAFGGDPARRALALEVHRAACNAMLTNGEPGYWNSSLSNVGELGEVIATNPCGEITLEAWEACNLGHVNLDWFMKDGKLNLRELREAHRLITRFLIRSTYADINDPGQRAIQDRNRRIGVGHLGVQGFWAKRGVKYSDIASSEAAERLLRALRRDVRQAADEYAFQLRIPAPVKVTTVAPTGSIAKLPGVSEGIHPIYAKWYDRRIRFSLRDPKEFGLVADYMAQGFKMETDVYDVTGNTAVVVFPTEDILVAQVRALGIDPGVVQSADELSIFDMLDMQAFYQAHWADNAVSYTVNLAEGAVSTDALMFVLGQYLTQLKGTTIMVDASREQAPYTRISEADYAVAEAKRVEDSTDENCSSGACPIK